MITPVPACSLCGKWHDEVRKIIVNHAVDAQGRSHEVSICDECIATFMTIMASEDREWFDRQVDESRAFRVP
jgi:ATP-dependent protease Clp ATPase subunit